MSAALAFFTDLFEESVGVVSSLPLTVEPVLMGYITGTLEPAVEAARAASPFAAPAPASAQADGGEAAPSPGLNTVGMLLDRLSILSIKSWNLVHRKRSPEGAAELRAGQIEELIGALAQARPGHSSINNKMTSRRVEVAAATFPQAYQGLLTTNLLLWEAQEILYNHDILALPCEELRAYIDFFSRGNLSRNIYIESSDQQYWRAVEPS